jgi:hypothetical protein
MDRPHFLLMIRNRNQSPPCRQVQKWLRTKTTGSPDVTRNRLPCNGLGRSATPANHRPEVAEPLCTVIREHPAFPPRSFCHRRALRHRRLLRGRSHRRSLDRRYREDSMARRAGSEQEREAHHGCEECAPYPRSKSRYWDCIGLRRDFRRRPASGGTMARLDGGQGRQTFNKRREESASFAAQW